MNVHLILKSAVQSFAAPIPTTTCNAAGYQLNITGVDRLPRISTVSPDY